MKTYIEINIRVFPVKIRDNRSGLAMDDTIVLDKAQLVAGQSVGLDCKDLIRRLYNRQGYHVLEVGSPLKTGISIDLKKSYQEHVAGQLAAEK